jgi:hypothetical protein
MHEGTNRFYCSFRGSFMSINKSSSSLLLFSLLVLSYVIIEFVFFLADPSFAYSLSFNELLLLFFSALVLPFAVMLFIFSLVGILYLWKFSLGENVVNWTFSFYSKCIGFVTD